VSVRRRTRWALSLTAGCATAVLLVACGGSGDDGNGGGTGTEGGNPLAAYRDCLAEQGIDVSAIPTGGPDRSGFPQPSGSAFPRPSGTAFPRPSGTAFPGGGGLPGGGGPGGGMRPEGVDEETWQEAQEACRSTMPTGVPGGRPDGAGPSGRPGSGADAAYTNCLADHADETEAAAREACEVLSPSPS
jgi:hypothetical protein